MSRFRQPASILATLVLSTSAAAQCWEPTFGGQPRAPTESGSSPSTTTAAGWPSTRVDSSGRGRRGGPYIARWDGTDWSDVGGGMDSHVHAFAVFDDGSGAGPVLYAGGHFTVAGGLAASNIARWDGTAWSPVGQRDERRSHLPRRARRRQWSRALRGWLLHGRRWCCDQPGGEVGRGELVGRRGRGEQHVWALTVHDEGGGPELYAAGSFTMAGGLAANRIARWNGTTWSPLEKRREWPGQHLGRARRWDRRRLRALRRRVLHRRRRFRRDATWPSGMAAAGRPSVRGRKITSMPSSSTTTAAEWLSTWVGTIPCWRVPDEEYIMKWNGTQLDAHRAARGWHVRPPGARRRQRSGPLLFAGGEFLEAGAALVSGCATWDGTSWSALSNESFNDAIISALAVYDDGNGGGPSSTLVGPSCGASGALVEKLAKWDGTSWSEVGGGVSSTVRDLGVYDDGSGEKLYVSNDGRSALMTRSMSGMARAGRAFRISNGLWGRSPDGARRW